MASVQAVHHKQRIAKAINSLEPFGLKRTEIMPTLKSLLRIYNNEWDFIEAENYRTLIDSIFEAQEAQVAQTSRGGNGDGGAVTGARRAHSGSGSDDEDDVDNTPSPPWESSQPAENQATNRRCNGRSDVLVPVKKSDSPVSGPRGNALPDHVARAVDYHSGTSVRTRAATLSLQGGGSNSLVAQGREKGKSPVVSDSRRPPPAQTRAVKGPSNHVLANHVTVKLEVSDSLPAPEGFEKVAFEKVDGVIKVMTPNRAGVSPKPAPPLTTGVKIEDEARVEQSDPGNKVFAPTPLLAKDPTSNVPVLYVQDAPQEANHGPLDHEGVSWDQAVQRELSLDVAAEPSPFHLQIVPHGTVFIEDPLSAEKPTNVLAGPFFDQAPRMELEEIQWTAFPADNTEEQDGTVLSLVDYEDDPDPLEQGTVTDVVPIPDEPSEQVETPELPGAKIRPNFIVSGSKRDIVDAQIAFEPKRQKCETNTHMESADISESAPSALLNRRRLILSPSPSPDGRVNGEIECTTIEGAYSTAGVKRKLIIPRREGTSNSSKETCTSKGDHTMGNGHTTKALPDRCEKRDKGTLEDRGQVNRNSAIKRVKLEPGVAHPNAQRPKHNPADISRGTERIPIPFVNEFTSETIDHKFNYVPNNVVYQNAYFNISLARIGDEDCCVDCVDDCLNAPHSCPCTRETGGVFGYTQDGRLQPQLIEYEMEHSEKVYCTSAWDCPIERAKGDLDKCKGHPVRKFVKECWIKCGCSMQCGNRVVQRGISRRLQVFFTNDGKGWGLRTAEDLPVGSFVCEYVGEIMTNMELDQRNQEVKKMEASGQAGTHKDTYPVLLDGDWCSESGLKDEEALCLDATRYGNVARFINHRCMDANLIDVPVTIEGLDRHYYHVAFFTNRDVKAGEELTWDYKIDFEDEEHPIEAFLCLCKSQFCRGARANGTKKHKK